MNFIVLGMGYISGKHLDAMKAVGGNLLAYHDIHDVVGHVDSRFIDASYYPDFIHFDCFVDRLQRTEQHIDYAVILLPNHLHNPACRWAMSHGMNVIVEKPLVIHEQNLDELLEVEERTGKKVNVVLQMRLHENAKKLIEDCSTDSKHFFVKIEYNTPRGPWFKHGSWKADLSKSGGLAASIGIHLFDLCSRAFGEWIKFEVTSANKELVQGWTSYRKADVEWSLSIEPHKKVKRVFAVNGKDYELTNGFQDLHTETYRKVLSGEGFGIEDIRMATRLTENIRSVCQ